MAGTKASTGYDSKNSNANRKSYLELRKRKKARAFCLSVRGSVRSMIRETPALSTFEGERSTFGNIARIELETPFRKVARQMGFTDRMMRAENRALHEAETAFGGVHMNETAKANIFIGAVIYRAMAGQL